MAEKRIPFPVNRTDIPLSPRRPPGGEEQARERNRPEAPVARSSPGRSGILVLPRLPREETSSSNDSTSSIETSMQSDGWQESSGSAEADSADDGKKLSLRERLWEALPGYGTPQPRPPRTEDDGQKLSFREMVREGLPDHGMPQPATSPTEEAKLSFYEFLRQESPPPKLSPSPGAKNKSKDKGSREREKTSPASGAASGRVRLLQRAATESDRPRAAHTGADPAWGSVTPKPNLRGHDRNVSADGVAQTSPEQRAERRAEPEANSHSPRSRSPQGFTTEDRERRLKEAKGLASHAPFPEIQVMIVKMAMGTEHAGFSDRALKPDSGQETESTRASSLRNRDDGKASAQPVPSMRRQDSGSAAQCFPGGFFTYRRAHQSDAQSQPTLSSMPDAGKAPQDAGKALQDDGKARIDILIGAERKALAQGKKGQGGEMTQGDIRAFFRTDKPVVWEGQTINAFKLVTEFVKPRLERCEIGRVLQKSKNKVLKDEVLKELAQNYVRDRTNTILIVATENGKNAGNYALLKPYIDRVLKNLRPKADSPATACLPAEVRQFLLDMDAEIVKLCLESKALDIHAINEARMNAIISILFTRGLVPQIDIAAAQENSWERILLTAFSTCLNSKLNLDSKSFLFSIIAEATEALPGDLRRQLAHRRAATVAKPTRFRERDEQTENTAPETGRRPIPVGGLRATCGSMQMRASGVAAIRAKKQALKAFEASLQLYKLAEPFLAQLKERLENLPAIDATRQKLCQAVLDYIPIYIDQLKADPAALDTASLELEVKSLLKLQAALQEEVAPAETVQLSAVVQPALQEEAALSETARSSGAELDAQDHISSPTLNREDSQAESDDREAPLPAPEEKEKEKI